MALYRLLLVAVLLVVQELGLSARIFSEVDPGWYRWTGYGYALAALLLLLPLGARRPALQTQTYLQFLTDLLAIVSLVFASGGAQQGLGVLLVVPAVGSALILSMRMAMGQAALATLAMFAQEFVRQLSEPSSAAGFTAAGVLGMILFGSTLTASVAAQRARRSEALAEQVEIDFENLTRLNESIIEGMQTGVVVADSGLRIRSINATARHLLRASSRADGNTLHAEAKGLAERVVDWLRAPHDDQAPFHPSSNTPELVARISRMGEGSLAPILILLDDAAKIREQAQQMKLAALGRLSASVAHEIRNPLAAISHAGQLLTESVAGSGNQQQAKLLRMIHRHSERIDRIVRDVLSLSRREAASLQPIALRQWLQRAVATYAESSPFATERIVIEDMPHLMQVRFDTDHLQQLLFNLWDNAFAHGRIDGDETRLTLRAGREDNGRVWLEVADNGPGISAEIQDRIFEPFFTTGNQGSGLGLFLARELCETNQARISYVGRADEGARFRISFSAGVKL